ncbi:Serine/threonine protein kinase Rhodoplastic [Gracilaria domingensis]|nr:Serine/threonine protein kinase Rhodoplastic [Gracilaria domingensis]
MPKRTINEIEGWAGYRHRLFGVPQKKYLKLSGATITIHPTPTGIIESYISVGSSTVTISILGRVLTIQVQSGFKYYLHFQSRLQCQEWAAFMKNASTRTFGAYYQIGEKIGEGSFASVHKGTRRADGAVVAVKKVVKQQFDMVTYRELQREIYTMQNIQHAGIVKTYDVFNTPTEAHFVLEFMHGGSLKDLVRKAGGRLSEVASLAMTKQVLQALAYLHQNGYAHRDIKLENILCETEEMGSTRVCLADFGYANFFEDPGDECMRSLIGTPVYVAPEIFHEKPYSEAVDMYAVGVMIYRMLCGEYPYDGGEDNDKTRDLVLEGKLEFRQIVWKEISAEAKSLVRGLLQPTPRKRLTAQGALQHSWFSNRRQGRAPNSSRPEGLSLPGTTTVTSQTPGIGEEVESTTIISRVAPVNKSNENSNEPQSPRVQDLIVRFKITNDSHIAEPNSNTQDATRLAIPMANPINVDGKHNSDEPQSPRVQDLIARFRITDDTHIAEQRNDTQDVTGPAMPMESPIRIDEKDPRTTDNDGIDIRHSDHESSGRVNDVRKTDACLQSRPGYNPEELRKKLKRCILAAVFSSKLLLVAELRRPKRRRVYHTISEHPNAPDRRKEERGERSQRRYQRPSSQSIGLRAFSFSGRMSRSGLTLSPVARLTSRLKRTLSLGRDRR